MLYTTNILTNQSLTLQYKGSGRDTQKLQQRLQKKRQQKQEKNPQITDWLEFIDKIKKIYDEQGQYLEMTSSITSALKDLIRVGQDFVGPEELKKQNQINQEELAKLCNPVRLFQITLNTGQKVLSISLQNLNKLKQDIDESQLNPQDTERLSKNFCNQLIIEINSLLKNFCNQLIIEMNSLLKLDCAEAANITSLDCAKAANITSLNAKSTFKMVQDTFLKIQNVFIAMINKDLPTIQHVKPRLKTLTKEKQNILDGLSEELKNHQNNQNIIICIGRVFNYFESVKQNRNCLSASIKQQLKAEDRDINVLNGHKDNFASQRQLISQQRQILEVEKQETGQNLKEINEQFAQQQKQERQMDEQYQQQDEQYQQKVEKEQQTLEALLRQEKACQLLHEQPKLIESILEAKTHMKENLEKHQLLLSILCKTKSIITQNPVNKQEIETIIDRTHKQKLENDIAEIRVVQQDLINKKSFVLDAEKKILEQISDIQKRQEQTQDVSRQRQIQEQTPDISRQQQLQYKISLRVQEINYMKDKTQNVDLPLQRLTLTIMEAEVQELALIQKLELTEQLILKQKQDIKPEQDKIDLMIMGAQQQLKEQMFEIEKIEQKILQSHKIIQDSKEGLLKLKTQQQKSQFDGPQQEIDKSLEQLDCSIHTIFTQHQEQIKLLITQPQVEPQNEQQRVDAILKTSQQLLDLQNNSIKLTEQLLGPFLQKQNLELFKIEFEQSQQKLLDEQGQLKQQNKLLEEQRQQQNLEIDEIEKAKQQELFSVIKLLELQSQQQTEPNQQTSQSSKKKKKKKQNQNQIDPTINSQSPQNTNQTSEPSQITNQKGNSNGQNEQQKNNYSNNNQNTDSQSPQANSVTTNPTSELSNQITNQKGNSNGQNEQQNKIEIKEQQLKKINEYFSENREALSKRPLNKKPI